MCVCVRVRRKQTTATQKKQSDWAVSRFGFGFLFSVLLLSCCPPPLSLLVFCLFPPFRSPILHRPSPEPSLLMLLLMLLLVVVLMVRHRRQRHGPLPFPWVALAPRVGRRASTHTVDSRRRGGIGGAARSGGGPGGGRAVSSSRRAGSHPCRRSVVSWLWLGHVRE